MPAFSTLQLKNQAGTETSFGPAQIDPSNKVATWLGAGSTFDARVKVSHSLTLPTGRATRVRIKDKIVLPVLDSETGLKIDEVIIDIDFSLPKNSALSLRQDVRAYAADLLTDPVVVKAVEDFESVY